MITILSPYGSFAPFAPYGADEGASAGVANSRVASLFVSYPSTFGSGAAQSESAVGSNFASYPSTSTTAPGVQSGTSPSSVFVSYPSTRAGQGSITSCDLISFENADNGPFLKVNANDLQSGGASNISGGTVVVSFWTNATATFSPNTGKLFQDSAQVATGSVNPSAPAIGPKVAELMNGVFAGFFISQSELSDQDRLALEQYLSSFTPGQ